MICCRRFNDITLFKSAEKPVPYKSSHIFILNSIFAITTNRVIVLLYWRKESPDSIGQCTGEEPGPVLKNTETDSATENNCLRPPTLLRRMDFIRVDKVPLVKCLRSSYGGGAGYGGRG